MFLVCLTPLFFCTVREILLHINNGYSCKQNPDSIFVFGSQDFGTWIWIWVIKIQIPCLDSLKKDEGFGFDKSTNV